MEISSSKKSIDKIAPQTGTFAGTQKNTPQTRTFVGTPKTGTFAETTKQGGSKEGHRLELDHERAMSMTGVRDVPVFTDKNITVRLDGETLLVNGQNLAVKTLDIESGRLSVTGRVFSLKYTSQAAPASLVKRIFK